MDSGIHQFTEPSHSHVNFDFVVLDDELHGDFAPRHGQPTRGVDLFHQQRDGLHLSVGHLSKRPADAGDEPNLKYLGLLLGSGCGTASDKTRNA